MRWLLTDLDHTLAYPKRKKSNIPGANISLFERDGQPHRGMTAPQQLIDMVVAMSDKRVAVTARQYEDVIKLDFPFQWDYIICQHGGEVYDESGKRLYSAISAYSSDIMKDIYRCLIRSDEGNGTLTKKINLVTAGNKAAFIEIKLQSETLVDDYIKQTELQYLLNEDIQFHQNKHVLTIMPRDMNKSHAVVWLLNNHIKTTDSEPLLIGAGDSHSDLAFMRLCHLCVAPSTSQIMNEQL